MRSNRDANEARQGVQMLFILVLGLLLGAAAAVLLGQWRTNALTSPGPGRLPRPTVPEPKIAGTGGLVFVPPSRRRDAA